MTFNYKSLDGLALAELIKKKEVKKSEVVKAAIDAIEEKNPQLNAVINKFYEKDGDLMDDQYDQGPLAGVPMLLKDIGQEVAGEYITSGSQLFKDYQSKTDNEFVGRLRETGGVFLGFTNVPEFALMGVTEPSLYGATRNPWNLGSTPGGSSGGSAAAVASGMVPIAGANDGGGSIRIPGAYCGLFGLKPSRGRTPVGPNLGRNWQGATSDHVLTRSVRDSAAVLDELTKLPDRASAFMAPPFDGTYLECVGRPLDGKKYRLAFTLESPIGTEVHPDSKEAVLKTVGMLEEMGFNVEEKTAPVDGKKIANSYITMYFGEVSAAIASAEELLNRKATRKDVEPTTWLLNLLGRATSAEEFVLSLREWDKAAILMEEFHDSYDFYITPTTAFPPAKIGELDNTGLEKGLISLVSSLRLGGVLKKTGLVEQIIEKSLMRTPFTQLANLTGQPAMSLPMHLTKDNLPCGVQVIARRGREDLLYQLAGMLEESDLWLDVTKQEFY